MALQTDVTELERKHQALEREIQDAMAHPSTDSLKVAELSPDEKKSRRRVGTIIAQWIRAKEICTVQKRDERRHKTPHYGVPGVTRDDD